MPRAYTTLQIKQIRARAQQQLNDDVAACAGLDLPQLRAFANGSLLLPQQQMASWCAA